MALNFLTLGLKRLRGTVGFPTPQIVLKFFFNFFQEDIFSAPAVFRTCTHNP